MSFASRFLTALAGLALIWVFWPFGGNNGVVKSVEPPPSAHDERLFTAPITKPTEPAEPRTPQELPESRNTEDAQTAALSSDAMTPEAKRVPKRLYRVIVVDGGTLKAGGTTITLDGIQVRDAEAVCKDSQGRKWACGTRARAALTRLIRGRAVECKVPPSAKPKTMTARCTVGGTDLSLWMARQGWAEVDASGDERLADAAGGARKKKIGLWR
jgi:endonuclease YncB( thermonuclease family)